MAVYEIQGQQFEVPDNIQGDQLISVLEEINQSIAPGTTSATTTAPATAPTNVSAAQQQPGGIDSNQFVRGLAEFAAGANRSILGFADFLGPDTVNAILELGGSESRVPTFTEKLGSTGGFLEPGLARDVLGAAGEVAGLGLGVGGALRGVAGRLPALTAGEPVAAGVTRQLAATTPVQDVTIGALSGAGAELGGEVAGEPGRVIGSLALPAVASGAASVAQTVRRGLTGDVSAPAKEVIQAGQKSGVPVLTTDVLPPKGIIGGLARQAGERIPLFGTSGTRAAQQTAREQAAVEFANQLPRVTADDVVQSLKAQTSKVKKAAGNRLESVKIRLDEQGAVPLTNTQKSIDDAIERLDSVKIQKDTGTINVLQNIKSGASERHVFSDLRDARTAVRETAESTDPLIRSQLPSKSKAAIKSIERAMTKDLDDFVLANEGQRGLSRYKQADSVWANEAIKLTKSRLKNVLDKGDITPEAVETLLFSKKLSEVKILHNSLTAEGKAAARSALVANAVKKAGGVEDLNPNALARELKKLETSTDIFFKGKDKQILKGFRKLLTQTKRAQDAPLITPTGQSLIALTGVGAGAQVGLIPTLSAAATAGGAARIYESPAVRNFLLRLANTAVDSPGFNQILSEAIPNINAVIELIQKEDNP